jgi:hypothetical protein
VRARTQRRSGHRVGSHCRRLPPLRKRPEECRVLRPNHPVAGNFVSCVCTCPCAGAPKTAKVPTASGANKRPRQCTCTRRALLNEGKAASITLDTCHKQPSWRRHALAATPTRLLCVGEQHATKRCAVNKTKTQHDRWRLTIVSPALQHWR